MLSINLKELRSQKGATQDDMAALLKIKRQTYSAYERGVSVPDINALIKMAEFFGISVDELLGIKKDRPEEGQPLSELFSDLSEDELSKVIEYVDFLKSKRNS